MKAVVEIRRGMFMAKKRFNLFRYNL